MLCFGISNALFSRSTEYFRRLKSSDNNLTPLKTAKATTGFIGEKMTGRGCDCLGDASSAAFVAERKSHAN
jgi:hypothetical protein